QRSRPLSRFCYPAVTPISQSESLKEHECPLISSPADCLLERRSLAVRAQRLSEFPRIGFERGRLLAGQQASANRRPDLQKLPPARPAVFHRPTSGAILPCARPIEFATWRPHNIRIAHSLARFLRPARQYALPPPSKRAKAPLFYATRPVRSYTRHEHRARTSAGELATYVRGAERAIESRDPCGPLRDPLRATAGRGDREHRRRLYRTDPRHDQ